MERKFRVIVHDCSFGEFENGRIYTESEVRATARNINPFIERWNGTAEMWNSNWIGCKFEEITKPRIELRCVGFEEWQSIRVLDEGGAICHMNNPYESYTVENGIIIADGEMWPYATVMCAKGSWSIELIPQPTEEDKQIAELKETIEEDMRKIE